MTPMQIICFLVLTIPSSWVLRYAQCLLLMLVLKVFAHRCGFLWFGNAKQFVSIQWFLQDPVVADAYRYYHDIRDLCLKVGLQGSRQHSYENKIKYMNNIQMILSHILNTGQSKMLPNGCSFIMIIRAAMIDNTKRSNLWIGQKTGVLWLLYREVWLTGGKLRLYVMLIVL